MRFLALFLFCCGLAAAQNWPSFRGSKAAGIAEGHELPVQWDAASGEGVKWRVKIPGMGLSSPIVWDDKLYITTAVSTADNSDYKTGLYGDIGSVNDESEHEWKVLAFDKTSGKLLWEKTLHKGVPEVKRHPKSSHANTTMTTDGEYLVVFFGSEGLYAMDMKGKVLWEKDFGVLDAGFFAVPEAQWEFASSPVIHEGKVFVQVDVQKNSFVGAFRLSDGKELWRTAREVVPAWSTPLVHAGKERQQVVVNGYKHAGAYDAETGEELWRVVGGGDIPTPTPIYGDGLFFFTNAHGKESPVYAVGEDARGTLKLSDKKSFAWVRDRAGAYMSTPLYWDGRVYVCRWNGILGVYRAATGERIYQQRVAPGAFSASLVGGDGKLYIASEEGKVFVVKAGDQYEVLAENDFGEPVLATPAISDGTVFFRTATELIAVQ